MIALAIRCLWLTCQVTARLEAIATPKGVLGALIATADPERHNYYQVHAAEDCLCDWKPDANELSMLRQSLHITYVEESARWMGSCKHNYWHWLHCQLPQGQVRLTDLKLTHPEVIPNRDRIAAPMRLASRIRFETLMASDDWEGAISMLVSNIHQPDQELLRLLAGQEIASMEEAQALLLRNFRVWLTESLIQDAARRVSAIKEAAFTLLDIVQDNPLAGNSHAHQSGARACHSIYTEMEMLEEALRQIS